jgi:hypothetical protein
MVRRTCGGVGGLTTTVDHAPLIESSGSGVSEWSISTRSVDAQIPPDSSLHWHFPSSCFQTSRFTSAGM